MVRPFSFRRAARLLLAVCAAVAFPSGKASAEEALVLDNGGVLRGSVVREDADVIVFRLAGIGTDNRITVSRRHVRQRFTTASRSPWEPDVRGIVAGDGPASGLRSLDLALASLPVPPTPRKQAVRVIPTAEPTVGQETFFERTARRAAMAFPSDASSRFLLVCMAVVVLLALVAVGGRMAEIPNLSLGRTTFLALLLGGLLTMDVVWRDMFVRADHAIFFLPLEILSWVASAAVLLKCGFGRAFTLLAFVLVSGALVGFGAAAILVLV